MIQNGAQGAVFSQIRKVAFPESQYHRVTGLGKKLRRTLNGVEAHVETHAYIPANRPINATYQAMVERLHEGEVITNLDFHNKNKTAETVNDFVKETTKDKITSMVDSDLFDSKQMILMSPAYFKANWKYKFEKDVTVQQFYGGDGSEKMIEYMTLFNEVLHSSNFFASALILPFADCDFAFSIFMHRPCLYCDPKTRNAVTDFRNNLNSSVIFDLLTTAEEWPLEVTIPKFTIESDISYIEPLKALGITEMFSAGSDLSGISENIYVSHAVHQAKIEVNEEGANVAQPIGHRTVPKMEFLANRLRFAVTYQKYPIFIGEFHG